MTYRSPAPRSPDKKKPYAKPWLFMTSDFGPPTRLLSGSREAMDARWFFDFASRQYWLNNVGIFRKPTIWQALWRWLTR